MSLVTPILQTQKSFDQSNGAIFFFQSVGGSTVVKNRLTIKKNSDNSTVYQSTQTTILFKHTLSSTNDLVNGNIYNAYINTYDDDGNISENSNIIQFTCYTTPTLVVDNIPTNDIITTSNFNFNVVYDQTEFELLDGVIFKLYDEDDNLLVSSSKLYNYNSPPLSISYLIGGMEDLTTYKLQVEGTTVNQTEFQSSIYEFFVSYNDSILNSSLTLTNNCQSGCIEIDVENTLIQGNSISDISAIKIKRKLETSNNWVDVYEKQVSAISDLSFSIIDNFAPFEEENFEYAIVPVLSSGVEINYTIESVKSSFNGVFVSDINNSYKLVSNVGIQRNQIFDRGVLQPIGSRVPFIVSNSETNYESGTVTGKLLGNFEETRMLDRKNIVNYTKEFIQFLTNGEIKVIKDWNGNICVCAVIGSASYNNDLLTGFSDISFQYNEQGKYDNQDDLITFGLIRGD